MSTVDADIEVQAQAVAEPGDLELTQARTAQVGAIAVRRMLPLRLRRSVGPWCFIDHYGPMDVDGVAGMDVPPHPHIGLQTVTWLLAGNVLHHDSLGNEQMIRPGQLNLMTSGRGIAHAEESPAAHDPTLHGVQLWVALPAASRGVDPAFEHLGELPETSLGRFRVSVLIGELAGLRSPATAFSPIAGAQLSSVSQPAATVLALRPDYEHVLFAAAGHGSVDGHSGTDEVQLEPGQLLYLPAGRHEVAVSAPAGSTLILLGGEPLGEQLLMWWNFVARTPEEISAATAAWRAGEFGEVAGYRGEPLAAPPLDVTRLLRPR